jgi:hypothetical protein
MATTVSLPARFYAGSVPVVETAVWTVPAAETDVITSITVMNNTLNARTFNVKLAEVFLAYNLSIPPQTFMTLDIKQVINTAEIIKVTADAASSLTMFISGVKITTS